MDYNQKYDIDTICVNQDEKIERATGVIRKTHPTMICQTACHIEGFGENEAENLPNNNLASFRKSKSQPGRLIMRYINFSNARNIRQMTVKS